MAKKWFVIQTYSGYEAKVKEALLQRIKEHHMEDRFGEVLIGDVTHIRVDNGAYGKCEECGNPISEARLEAITTARYCIEDQSKHDKNGRRNGR